MPPSLKTSPHVAITGASSGIGAELAACFAGPGVGLSLIARRTAALEAVAARCVDKGADVSVRSVDVTDPAALAAWFADIDRVRPVDCLVVNAGVFDGHGPAGALETPDQIRRMIDVNLTGAIHTAQAALPAMMARRSGHIAFVGSLAAILPLADAPAYSASKAGLDAYAVALQEFLLGSGVSVSRILPGHVRTFQTDRHVGPLPLILTADEAAARIKAGLERHRPVVAFPAAAYRFVQAARVLPVRWRAMVNRGNRFHLSKPD